MHARVTPRLSQGVPYHYGQFPPKELDYSALATPLAEAAAALAGYEQMLKGLHNASLFLTPLQRQEAISSSRMEGTISTLDELLEYEAHIKETNVKAMVRRDTLEVHAYRQAIRSAEKRLGRGEGLSSKLLCSIHNVLLGLTRGSEKAPGKLKTEQNFLVDMSTGRVLFTPISPDDLQSGLEALFSFIHNDSDHPLIRTAIAHIEFESLHPFNDGNGRIGRILITLMLWKLGLISHPYFYISGYLEDRKHEYISQLRAVSSTGDWTAWCLFFLAAVRSQAEKNLMTAEEIQDLYTKMKEAFRVHLSSKWAITALDFVFAHPIFRNSTFAKETEIPGQTASNFTRKLLRAGLLSAIRLPSGRQPGLYAFEPLLKIVRM